MKTVAALLLISLAAFASDRAPLPKQILEAKTVYIENQTNLAVVADQAYEHIKKWPRLTLVTSREKADIILVFTNGIPQNSRSVTTGTVIGNTVIANSSPSTLNSVTLTITTGAGERLWADTKPFSRRGATADLMRDLRKRLE